MNRNEQYTEERKKFEEEFSNWDINICEYTSYRKEGVEVFVLDNPENPSNYLAIGTESKSKEQKEKIARYNVLGIGVILRVSHGLAFVAWERFKDDT